MVKRIILFGVFPALIIALGVWYYVFVYSKNHHRDVMNEKAIQVTSVQIVKGFQASENTANSQYLNKALEITGQVAEVKKDQAGNTTVTLKSDDPFVFVLCTLKKQTAVNSGQTVKIKGICTGFLSDVVINDAYVVEE
ncbi:MAG: hypothetical protein KGO81_11600 [Bacteroidota bacterium]|nr:hypothetical protein [Bacteroidota bacterium]